MSQKQFVARKPKVVRKYRPPVNAIKKQEDGDKRSAVQASPALIQRATQAPQTITPAEATRLQRTVGNQALGRLSRVQAKLTLGPVGDKYEQEADAVAKQVVGRLSDGEQSDVQRQEEEEELQMKPISDLQRQEEEEEELQMKPISDLQRQEEEEEELQMKPISDLQRQEEEEEELQMKPSSDLQRQEDEEELQMKPSSDLQRQEEETEEEEEAIQPKRSSTMEGGDLSAGIEGQIQRAKGGGRPLSPNTQSSMESAFNSDFSGVKVHTDGRSDQLNQSIQARAFTTGQDIFFRQGEYNPNSSGGQELLAHELTHTIQQTGGIHRSPSPISPISSGLQRDSIQRVELPTLEFWKKRSSLKWTRRSSELKKIDKALALWHVAKSANDDLKRKALNQLWAAIQNWQMSKKDGGKESKRNVFIRTLQLEVKEMLSGLQQAGETATMTLNVDVESDDPMDRKFGELMDSKVGHAWMTLKYDAQDPNRLADTTGFTAQNKSKLQAGTPQEASFGFWPVKFRDAEGDKQLNYETTDMSEMGSSTLRQPDDSHDAKATKSYRVTNTAVNQIGDYVEASKGKTYHMYEYNCTSFALGVVKSAGHTPPKASQKNMNQPNRLYKSLHRLAQTGDESVTDQIEVVRTITKDTSKTYANLTAEEAEAVMVVSRNHHKIRKELGLRHVEDEAMVDLRSYWETMSEDRQDRLTNPVQRMVEFSGMLPAYGRLVALQMAAVLMHEKTFKQWHTAVTHPVKVELTEKTIKDEDKTYANLTDKELEAIMTVTLDDEEKREELDLLSSSELVTSLWNLWEMFSMPNYRDRLRDSSTRLAEIRAWILRFGDVAPEFRLMNMQLVALVMDTEAFTKWIHWADAQEQGNHM